MKQVINIARRELSGMFFSPIGYLVLGLFTAGATLLFFLDFQPHTSADLRSTFGAIVFLLILIAPAISMRLVSEELHTGTIEPLMTAPVTDTEVILGKWLGAMVYFTFLLIAPLAVLLTVLEIYASPDYGPIFTGLLGLLLVGGFYLAIGTFASATSENQIIAVMVTVFIICMFTLLTSVLGGVYWLSPEIREVVYYLNVNLQYQDFSKGLIDTSNLVYFISGTALFLFFAVLLLQSKRWR